MNTPVLEVKNVYHSYGQRRVLSGVSFSVQRNSVLCLIGISGSGKTTLLRIIAGLIKPKTGEVLIDGRKASHMPTHLRDIGFVFQTEAALFPHLDVYNNIAFPFRHGHKEPRDGDWRLAVNKIIHDTGLGAHIRSPIAELSGGLKQRVAIARAIVYKPSILLLDEPLSSLDNLKRAEIFELLTKLKEESGTTFVYVTHDDREVKEFGTHVAVLNNGVIEQYGTLSEVLNQPQSSFVSELLHAGS